MKGDGRDGVSRREMGHDLGMDHLFDMYVLMVKCQTVIHYKWQVHVFNTCIFSFNRTCLHMS